MNQLLYGKRKWLVIIGSVVVILAAALLIYSNTYSVASYHSLLELPTFEEMIEESSLVVYGRVEKKKEAIEVLHVNGLSSKVFTDYKVTPIEVLRGEEEEGGPITIRVDGGGPIERTMHVYEEAPVLEEGNEYLFFANRPIGGGFTTEGDYYILRSQKYAVFNKADNQELREKNLSSGEPCFLSLHHFDDAPLKTSLQSNQSGQAVEMDLIALNDIEKVTKEVNNALPTEEASDGLRKEYEENLLKNLESETITKAEYEEFLKELNEYGTIK